jgi:PAS domain S-box-containing protein
MAEADAYAIAELTTRAARDVLDIPLSSVRFARGDALEMVALTTDLDPPPNVSDRPPYPIDGTIPGRVYRTGERAVGNVENTDDGLDRDPVESGAYIPLGDHGVFSIGAREPDAFGETDVQLATVLAANAEAALDRAEKEAELRQERDDFAALFENIPDPTIEVVMRDDQPIVKRVNSAFEETFGYEAETVRGEDLDEYVLPDDPEKRVSATEYNSRIQAGESLHAEVRRVTSDGLRDFIIHTVPHDVGAETARGYAIYTDITEQKQRERELKRQNERLDEFASVVSHDLRNPLSVARGHLELARTVDEGADDHFDAVDRAHERMDELINRLLAFARQGDPATAPTEIPLAEATRDAWGTVETGSLSLDVDETRAIRADPDRLRQLFENLFRNTVEHGVGASKVTVGALDRGFYVEDDGPGIPESERDSVVKSGYSGGDGTGFGLAIVDAVADSHGWTLVITDGDGGGARFEFHDGER